MKEAVCAEGSSIAHLLFRKLSEQDRDVMDKGVKAFVSYIRAYKEHQCKFIFRLADMDLALLATAFGLLQLPKMPELKKARQRLQGFQASNVAPQSVKVTTLHYKTAIVSTAAVSGKAIAQGRESAKRLSQQRASYCLTQFLSSGSLLLLEHAL